MSFLAQVSYTGNGSTTQYSITFPYIDVTHVKAYLDGVLTTAYTISSSTLTFTTAPANGVVIRIERETPNNNRLVDFTDGSVLTESDLDRSADQNFYIAQEITDDSSSKLGLDTDDKYDANNKVIKNLANPVNDTDAVNKQFISTNLPNITTVAGISADVTTVAGISGNVTTVAGNNANVSTVATNIASVNTVATNIADVITVANDLNEAISEIETTANDLNEAVSEIDTVGTNIASVQAVGTNIANVNTVAGSIANVNSVAGNSTNINAVAGNATNINAVNANSSNINAVNANSANINTVAGNNANVSTVAGISGNVTTVAGISADVTAVAGDATDIGTVATDIADVNTVAGSIANVNSVATNIANVNSVAGNSANINAVAGNATNINAVNANSANINTVAGANANVTTVAGSIANVNEVANNIGTVNNFGERYRVQAGEPSVNNDEGDLVYDTTANAVKVYNGTSFDTIQQGITDVAPTRHSIRPSLNLDFANSKVLDPRITFTRGSNATYYDGYTSVKAEENLIYPSIPNSSGYTVLNSTLTTNNTTSPDGTNTATLMTASSGTGIVPSIEVNDTESTATVVFTHSIFAKAGTHNYVQLTVNSQASFYANFDLSTGSVGTTGGGVTTSITDVGNSWYRISMTFTSSGHGNAPHVRLSLQNSSSDTRFQTWNPAGTETVYLWGGQSEQRDTITAYTPTTTAPITKYQPALQTAGNNVARFDHNPTTGESLGLLIEESRTNVLTYSEDINNVAWTKSNNVYTSNYFSVAPDGTQTAYSLLTPYVNTNSYYYIRRNVSAGTYTISFYLKNVTGNGKIWLLGDGSTTFVKFNLVDGQYVSTTPSNNGGGAVSNQNIENVGNGWYRCSFTQVFQSITKVIGVGFASDAYGDTMNPSLSPREILVWGVQVEAGSFPTSYIKTTGSQVTRGSDNAVMENIDTSEWFKQGQGTLYSELSHMDTDITGTNLHFLILNNSTTGDFLGMRFTGNEKIQFLNRFHGSYNIDMSSSNFSTLANTYHKASFSFTRNDAKTSVNGTATGTDTTCNIIEFDQLSFNYGSQQFNGHMKKASYYPINLTQNEINDLSEE